MNTNKLNWFLITLACSFMMSGCLTTQTTGPKPKPYPFEHCAVMKREFHEEEGALYRRVHDGYEVLFCCTPCVKAFDINPEPFMGPIREWHEQNPSE